MPSIFLWVLFFSNFSPLKLKLFFRYRYEWAARYSGVMYHAIHLTCTYIILYMTLVITFDRFVALILYRYYHRFNTKSVALTICLVCLILSAVVHSWYTYILRFVEEEIVSPFLSPTVEDYDDETNLRIQDEILIPGKDTGLVIYFWFYVSSI